VKLNLGDLTLTSTAFATGGAIPARHSADGGNVSPALSWSGAPEGTAAYALVCHDPDAPLADGFTHWVRYGIPASVTELAEGAPEDDMAGVNSADQSGWMGPQPPPGHGTHHYFFHLYALGSYPGLEPGLTREQLLAAIDEHILVQARLVGTFENAG